MLNHFHLVCYRLQLLKLESIKRKVHVCTMFAVYNPPRLLHKRRGPRSRSLYIILSPPSIRSACRDASKEARTPVCIPKHMLIPRTIIKRTRGRSGLERGYSVTEWEGLIMVCKFGLWMWDDDDEESCSKEFFEGRCCVEVRVKNWTHYQMHVTESW